MLRSAAPLALLLVLQLSGSDGQFIYPTVREGDDVTLSCEKVRPDQNQCQFTSWFNDSNSHRRVLFKHGNKTEAVSSSVSLLQNCSMVLHRVTKEEAGDIFTCRQDEKEKEETRFQMFVASLSQEKKDDRATLTCSVATPGECVHKVKWLNNNEEVKQGHEELQTSGSGSGCSVSVSFEDPSPPSPFYQTLRCEVEQTDTHQIFTLFPRAPDDKTTTPPQTGPDPETSPSTDMLLKVAVPVVIAASLILACVALMLWRRRRGSGDANGETVNPEDGVTYASVQINQKKTKNRKSPQSGDGEEDVTYSSVNVPGQLPSSEQRKTGDPEDNVTYVAVNFNNKKKKKKKSEKSGSRAEDEDVTYSSVNVAAAAGADSRLCSSVHKPK